MVLYQLDGIEKSYAGKRALDAIDLSVKEGERIALIGPSGCGKSTLIRIFAGLLQADGGDILFNGGPLAGEDLESYRRKLGYVIQHGGLFPHLSARENITLVARYLRWPHEKQDARIKELADLVHLDAAELARFPAELSGGQRQRVSLMRALMLSPEVLLLDEPLGALDPIIRYHLQEELCTLFKDLEATVILVTHDLAEAAYLADRIVLMRDGRIIQDGPFDDLIRNPADDFVSEFIQAQRGVRLEAGHV